MITVNGNQKPPVSALLLVDMVVNGKRHAAGAVVQLSAAEFARFSQYDRVQHATPENAEAFKAKAKSDAEAAKSAAQKSSQADPVAALRTEVAQLREELAKKK